MKSGKAQGDYNISNEFVKCLFPLIIYHIVKLFNDILVVGYFPSVQLCF